MGDLMMRRKAIFILSIVCIILAMMPLPMGQPYANYSANYSKFDEVFPLAGIGDDTTDYVDATSALHDPADKGTNSSFTNMQTYDQTNNTLTEENQGGAGTDYNDWFGSYTSNVDGSADVGTETNPVNAQDLGDSNYMTLQEANQGGAGGSEWLSVNAFDSTWDTFDITAGDSPWLGAQDQPTHMRGEMGSADAQLGWFDFPSTSLTGTITVNISCYTSNSDGAGDDWLDVWVDYTGSGAGADVGDVGQHTSWSYDTISLSTHSVAEVNNLRVYFVYKKSGGGDDVWIDHCRIGLNVAGGDDYELDFEYQWASANYSETNEKVCINVQTATQNTENLTAWEWTSSTWASLGEMTSNGWNNFTPSYLTGSTYTIKLNDTQQSSEGTQSTWSIDSIILHTWTAAAADYELDLEYKWTAVELIMMRRMKNYVSLLDRRMLKH
jgi:hypothetical protein